MPIFDRLKRCFDVDFNNNPKSANSVWDETNQMMCSRYSNNITKMHNYYKKLLDLPWEQRLEKMPEKYCSDERDWKFLCTLFDTDKSKDDMVGVREQYRKKRVDDGLPPVDEFELAFLVCDEVLGKRSGYIKGLGQGSKPSKSTFSDAGSRRMTNK